MSDENTKNPLLDEDSNEDQEDSEEETQENPETTEAPEAEAEEEEEVSEEAEDVEEEPSKAPKAKEPLQSEEVKPTSSFPQAQSQKDIGIEYGKMSQQMKEHLAKQPKVAFLIPLSDGEKNGAYETVQINGYRMVIKKGTMVQIPQQVAEILADHYRISSEAGQEYRMDRDDKTKDALS